MTAYMAREYKHDGVNESIEEPLLSIPIARETACTARGDEDGDEDADADYGGQIAQMSQSNISQPRTCKQSWRHPTRTYSLPVGR